MVVIRSGCQNFCLTKLQQQQEMGLPSLEVIQRSALVSGSVISCSCKETDRENDFK